MIIVPAKYIPEVNNAAAALIRARHLGMGRQLMKDLVDDICNDSPLHK